MSRGAVLAMLLLAGAAPAVGQDWTGTRLCAADLPRGGEFGSAVAVGDDGLIAVGDYRNDVVYLFQVTSGNCRQLGRSRGRAGEWFGFSLAIEGNILLVGAPRAGGTGAAYRIPFSGEGVFGQRQPLAFPGARPGDEIGSSVAIRGTTLAVGARGADDRRGRVYAGTESAMTPVPTPPGLAPRAELGQSVALDGSTLVMGAPSPYLGSGSPGAAYVYRLNSGIPPERLPPPAALEAESAFGYAVALEVEKEEARLLVGAPLADANGADAGAVFRYAGTGPEPVLVGVDPGDQLGVAVALDGGTAMIGARYAGGRRGAAYLVGAGGGVRTLQAGQPGRAQLGFSVALRGELAVVGAFQEGETGAAYAFEPPPPTVPTCQVPVGLTVVPVGASGREVRDLVTAEDSGTPALLSVRLTCRPDADVTVTLRTTDATEATVAPGRLRFTPDDWDSSRTVQVKGQDDALCDGLQSYSVTVRSASTDARFEGHQALVTARNADDERACLSAVKEVCVDGDGTVVYTITLSNAGPQAPAAPAHLVDRLPGEVAVVTATADRGTATADPVASSVEWSGPVPAGENAVTITIVAGLDPVPPGTEVRNRADLAYVRDARGNPGAVSSNDAVFRAGETSCDSPPPP